MVGKVDSIGNAWKHIITWAKVLASSLAARVQPMQQAVACKRIVFNSESRGRSYLVI